MGFGEEPPPAMPEMAPMGVGDGFGAPAPMGGLGDEFAAPASLGPLAKWRIEQQEKLAAKAAAAESATAEVLDAAKQSIATFYTERDAATTKRAAANREAEARYVEDRDAAMIADSWESVCKLVDIKADAGKADKAIPEKDTSRMRGILLQLKHT